MTGIESAVVVLRHFREQRKENEFLSWVSGLAFVSFCAISTFYSFVSVMDKRR